MATNQGPASGNGVITASVPGSAGGSGGFAVTEGIEVQVPNGAPSLEPSRAPFVDIGQAGTTITGAQITPINSTFVFGNTGATLKFANPA
jgi:hypothetical protein